MTSKKWSYSDSRAKSWPVHLFQQLNRHNPLTPKQQNLLHYGEEMKICGAVSEFTNDQNLNIRHQVHVTSEHPTKKIGLLHLLLLLLLLLSHTMGQPKKSDCAFIQKRHISTVTFTKTESCWRTDLCAEWCNKLLAYSITPEQHD